MKTLVCQKAVAFSLLLILLFSLSIETAYSAEQEVVRVDQVYADLPEMQVYFHLLDKNGEVVTRTVSESNVLLQYNSERAEVNSVQNAAASKTQVYFLLDISDSMPTALFESIKAELLQLYQTHSQNEKYTLITFGEEVVVQLDGDESAETIESTIKSLQNTDTRTVLYDAVSKVGELAAERSDYTRRMIYLFTDGEDWTVGGHTQNETQDLIRQSGIEQFRVQEIVVDALGLTVDAADERHAIPCGFLFLHDVEHHAAHGGAGLCAPLVVHKMYDGDTAHRPSMTDRSAALTSDSSCAALSRPRTCTLPMLARTVRRLMLLPMPLSWRSSSFCSSMTTIRLPRQQAVT